MMKPISPPKFKTRSPTPFVIGEILNGCECHPFSEIETKTRHGDMVRADVYITRLVAWI